jgi:putative transposase
MNDKLHRRSIRLKQYDYAQAGAYFVTICTHKRQCSLGAVEDGSVSFSAYGQVVTDCWQDLPRHFGNIDLDAFIVMLNHFHGIVVIRSAANSSRRGEALVGNTPGLPVLLSGTDRPRLSPTNASPLPWYDQPRGTQPGSLAAIVQNFKSISTRRINTLRGTPGDPIWQRNYYEHVARGDDDLNALRLYINQNALKWELDQLHPANPSRW